MEIITTLEFVQKQLLVLTAISQIAKQSLEDIKQNTQLSKII